MTKRRLPEWESEVIEEAIAAAEARLRAEAESEDRAAKRRLQLAREQAYHRLAVAIDRPSRRPQTPGGGQLSFFPERTLFSDQDDQPG